MSCHESARKAALECAGKLEYEARDMAVLRSVDATEAAKWLREIAAAIRGACGPDEPAETKKPSCIPADCQHFEQLPSGLWVWCMPDADCVYVRPVVTDHPFWTLWECDPDYKDRRPEFRAEVTKPDFLAARALGERVLGWAK